MWATASCGSSPWSSSPETTTAPVRAGEAVTGAIETALDRAGSSHTPPPCRGGCIGSTLRRIQSSRSTGRLLAYGQPAMPTYWRHLYSEPSLSPRSRGETPWSPRSGHAGASGLTDERGVSVIWASEPAGSEIMGSPITGDLLTSEIRGDHAPLESSPGEG